MNELTFIRRTENGKLEIKNVEWSMFRNRFLSMAKNQRELEFIGQLVEDLQMEYEERLDEFEEM
ncbi:hypothetical protein [Bacillus infantis]|uniref:hypothetical protein n=1 Tax=Bacillus infantis TaxID=324767 RepID=UPI003CF0A4D1